MKYAPIRLRTGHYAVLSDDQLTLYGVRAVDETGDATYGDTDRPVLGRFWDVVRLNADGEAAASRSVRPYVTRDPGTGRITALDRDALADSDDWDSLSTMHRTKRAALEALAPDLTPKKD